MPAAFVLIDADVNRVKSVLEDIRQIGSVTEAYTVAGERDIIAKAEADSFQEVAEDVTKGIHKIDGIRETVTFFAFE